MQHWLKKTTGFSEVAEVTFPPKIRDAGLCISATSEESQISLGAWDVWDAFQVYVQSLRHAEKRGILVEPSIPFLLPQSKSGPYSDEFISPKASALKTFTH